MNNQKKLLASFGLLMSFTLMPFLLWAQAGKDGSFTVATTGAILNRYSTLTASAGVGSSTLTVANITDLSAGAIAGANPFATANLSYGDLIMIIKMQGATINTTNTINYGAVTTLNNVGTYELKTVRGTTGNIITICGSLANAYAVGGTQRVQVIRIPRLSALTVNAGASVTALAWSGTYTGGVVALEVTGNTVVNGTITANGLGFRGAAVDNNTTNPPTTVVNYFSSLDTDGAEKGESIAGYQTDYDALGGRYDRGAAANGGGGGNAHNAGGGGGANASNGNTWTGQGVMITNASNPSAAWALDPGYIANSNALTNSSGGGRGGYTYGSNDLVATSTGPGNSGWGGDNRREAGGLGGHPLTYTINTLFMGGGGGAGDANNLAAQNGASGGGIIYLLCTGTLSGSGSITANGANALPTISGHNDAPGGGGGGGAIRLNVQGAITLTNITATGGTGGNQLITSNESEGPGGGGGGGFIGTTGSSLTAGAVNGAGSGTSSSTAITEFTFNGATAGATGSTLLSQAFVAAPGVTCFALPLTLVSFDAQITAQKEAVLSWVSEAESNLKNYTIEKSFDNLDWQPLATLAARNQSGRQQYSINAGLLAQATYFRLKMLNVDGSVNYSSVRFLAANSKLQVERQGKDLLVTGIAAGANALRVFSASGSLLLEQKIAGETTIRINGERFAAGLYYVKLYYRSGAQDETMKFVQQ